MVLLRSRTLSSLQSLLNEGSLTKFLNWIVSGYFSKFGRLVLVNELVDTKVTTSSANEYLTTFDFDADALRTELVCALKLTHEHHFQVLLLRVVVNVVSNIHVDWIISDRHVDGRPLSQLQDCVLEGLAFHFHLTKLLQCSKTAHVGLVHPRLQFLHVLHKLEIFLYCFMSCALKVTQPNLQFLVLPLHLVVCLEMLPA